MKFWRKRTQGSSAVAQWVRKTCPEGGQGSTGVWKPRQNPSEVGLRPMQSVSEGLEKSKMTSSFLLGNLAWAPCFEPLTQSKQKPVPLFENRKSDLNPDQAGVKPDSFWQCCLISLCWLCKCILTPPTVRWDILQTQQCKNSYTAKAAILQGVPK